MEEILKERKTSEKAMKQTRLDQRRKMISSMEEGIGQMMVEMNVEDK